MKKKLLSAVMTLALLASVVGCGSGSQSAAGALDQQSVSEIPATEATTETAEIEGITCAGASSKLMKYTPPADAELIQVGVPLSLPEIPQTPGATAPTPGIITKAALKLAKSTR